MNVKVLVGHGDKKDCYTHDNISKVIVKFEPLEKVTLVHGNTNTFTEYNVFQYKELTFEIREEGENGHHHNCDNQYIGVNHFLDSFPKKYEG